MNREEEKRSNNDPRHFSRRIEIDAIPSSTTTFSFHQTIYLPAGHEGLPFDSGTITSFRAQQEVLLNWAKTIVRGRV